MRLTINGIPSWPISAPFGSLDPSHPTAHNGVDFAINAGTPVPSISDGVVSALTNEGSRSFGQAVHVRLQNGDEVIYGHLSQFKCHVGQTIHQGDVLALSGSTGRSTGPHLHLEVLHNGQAVDPVLYFHMSGDGGTTGFETLDRWSEIWKQNAERIFHLPSVATDKPNALTQYVADKATHTLGEMGIWLLYLSPHILLVTCLGSLIGMMAGSERCRRWAGISFLGSLIAKAVVASVA